MQFWGRASSSVSKELISENQSITSYAWSPARNGCDNPAKIIGPAPSSLVRTWSYYWYIWLDDGKAVTVSRGHLGKPQHAHEVNFTRPHCTSRQCPHRCRAASGSPGWCCGSSCTSVRAAHAFGKSWFEMQSGEFTESFNSSVKTMQM